MTLQVCRDTFTLPGLQSAEVTNHTSPDPMPANHSSVLRWDDTVTTNQSWALPPSGLCGHCSNLGHDLIFWHHGPATRHCTAAANTEYRNSDMWLFGLSFNGTLNWSAPSFMEATVESEILWLLAWALSFSKKMQDCACKCNKISAQKVLQQLCYNLSAT